MITNPVTEWIAFNLQRRQIRRRFKKIHGYDGNFENPKTYQEKIQFRKLYGNHAFYSMVADKHKVRKYVAEKVGGEHLIPLLGVYDRLDRSVFEKLPKQFIIKANHGCKWHQIVYDKGELDIDKTIRHFNRLAKRRFGWSTDERHYGFIQPKIVVEELLSGAQGGSPWDYCFFCYRGAGGFDYNFVIMAPDGHRSASFDKDWNLVETNMSAEELAPHVRPQTFDEMVRIAHALSADFDFVRVDLYTVQDRVYFGELTCTPAAGYAPISNRERQKMRDEMWQLDTDNRLLYRSPRGLRTN